MAKKFPKGLKTAEDRRKLAFMLQQWVQNSEDIKGTIKTRWKKNEEQYQKLNQKLNNLTRLNQS